MNYRRIEVAEVISLLGKWLGIDGIDSVFALVPGISMISPYFLEKLLESQDRTIEWKTYRFCEIIQYSSSISEREEKGYVLDMTKEVDLSETEVILIADNMKREIIRLDGADLSEFIGGEFGELYGISIFGPYDIVMVFVDLSQILVYRRDGRIALLNLGSVPTA